MTFVVERPPWVRWAACRGQVTLFYDSSPAAQAVAQGVCGRCGVRAACLADVLASEAALQFRFGVRGGLTAAQRAALQSATRRPTLPSAGLRARDGAR